MLSRAATLFIAVAAALTPVRAFAVFGVADEGKTLAVDSGAGLVFKVNKTSGDIVSIHYKGGPELQNGKKGSHISSGLGRAKVTSTIIDGRIIKITLATDETNHADQNLTHYLIVRKGVNQIDMATFPAFEPAVGELRWITRLEPSQFAHSPKPSNNREASKTIESKDVFGCVDGTTRSKYFGDAETHGKDRAMDLSYCGVSGEGVGVWMVFGNRESSSGGPFHRDIENQSVEVYNYMNSGHNMTEPTRLKVLHGPYALIFTDGEPPKLPLDFSWVDTAGLDLEGYVPGAQRGSVAGTATGVLAGLQGVVGFSNPAAQYWATVEKGGAYHSPLMKPGSYEVKLYQRELVVGTGEVTVQTGATAKLDLRATPIPSALFKIGEWDGTPAGFLNGEKIVTMHPSDTRMAPWGPVTFTVGTDTEAKFPALQLRATNNPTTVQFNLTKEQIADHVLRIGITCSYGGSRPEIKVNDWSPKRLLDSTAQPRSRSFTIGTYRGNNATFTYRIPAGAFRVGANTLVIKAVSGSGDLSPWLTAGWAYDAIQLDAEPAPRSAER